MRLEDKTGELKAVINQSSNKKESILNVRLQDETIWLTIKQMAELFGVDKSGVSRHLKSRELWTQFSFLARTSGACQ